MNVRFCGKCGAALEPDGKFCEKCGWQVPSESVSSSSAKQSPTTPPPPVMQAQPLPGATAPQKAAPLPVREVPRVSPPSSGGPNAFNTFSGEMNRGTYNKANPAIVWIIVLVGLVLSGAGIFLLLK